MLLAIIECLISLLQFLEHLSVNFLISSTYISITDQPDCSYAYEFVFTSEAYYLDWVVYVSLTAAADVCIICYILTMNNVYLLFLKHMYYHLHITACSF